MSQTLPDASRGINTFKMGRAWVELNMENLRHNIRVLQSRLPDTCQLMPAVKADAYGHGAIAISRELNTCGIRAFCVASAAEGVELRKHGIKGEILILGYTHPNQLHLLIKYRLMQTVIDYAYAKTLDMHGGKFAVHIKVDTGMHRLGERCENINKILQIFKCKNLKICGIYTHLSTSDGLSQSEKTFTQAQVDKFSHVIALIKRHGLCTPKMHIISSYGVFNYPHLAYDYARVGIALYGMLSKHDDTETYSTGLRPVLSVKARISAVTKLYAGEAAGYGFAFEAPADMKIAILAIGYADGIPRQLSCGRGHVLINGQKAAIISHVCMDQMIVDISDIDSVRQGDIAVIIGQSGNAEITVSEMAQQAGTISNEILSRLGGRLERMTTPL